MSEEILRNMVEEIINKLNSLDLDILILFSDANAQETCSLSMRYLDFALARRDWENVKYAYILCAVQEIINTVTIFRIMKKPISDLDKKIFIQYFTVVLSPHEYGKYAREILEDIERGIDTAKRMKRKK